MTHESESIRVHSRSKKYLAHHDSVTPSVSVPPIPLLTHVKTEIESNLHDGIPNVEIIANRVGMPRWTLQRRLAEYELSFSDMVDLVRRELAETHVQRSAVKLSAISDLLGYSELSAFSRAFRRWFGVSPQAFRANMALVADPSNCLAGKF
jgi:AraC-like DNA-binding protein